MFRDSFEMSTAAASFRPSLQVQGDKASLGTLVSAMFATTNDCGQT
jgi:hypothetical protein